jgi:hypothetical protein
MSRLFAMHTFSLFLLLLAQLKRTDTMALLLEKIKLNCGIEQDLADVRLVKYAPAYDSVNLAITCDPSTVLGSLGFARYNNLLVQTRTPGGSFPPDNENGLRLMAVVANEDGTLQPRRRFLIKKDASVRELRACIAGISVAGDRPVRLGTMDSFYKTLNLCTDDTESLGYQGVRLYGGDVVYAEIVSPAADAAFNAILEDREKNRRSYSSYYTSATQYELERDTIFAWQQSAAAALFLEYLNSIELPVIVKVSFRVNWPTGFND